MSMRYSAKENVVQFACAQAMHGTTVCYRLWPKRSLRLLSCSSSQLSMLFINILSDGAVLYTKHKGQQKQQ